MQRDANFLEWTAVQTSYLDVVPLTTTGTNGATLVSTSTEYVSFVTTTTAPAGEAPTALIAAAVIAPALIVNLQPIVDGAAGKTTEELGVEIVTQLAKIGVVSTWEAQQLGACFLAVGTVLAIGATNKAYQSISLGSYLPNINVAPQPPANTIQPSFPPTITTSITTSSSSSSSVMEVTAIVDTPYTE